MQQIDNAPQPVAVTPYERCGGEAGGRRLCRRFYELMDTLPEARECRAVHPPSLARAEERLFEYLSGWLGGPSLFIERHGAPMLRRRRLHAPIGGPEAEGWLICFYRAWHETIPDTALGDEVLPKIKALGLHMRNTGSA